MDDNTQQQDNTPDTQQENVDNIQLPENEPQNKGKKKKPFIIVALIAVLLLGVGVAALLMNSSNQTQQQAQTDTTENTDQAVEEAAFTPQYFTAINQQISALGEDGTFSNFAKLEADEYLADIAILGGKPTGIFQKVVDSKLVHLGTVTATERKVAFTYPADTYPSYNIADVSPDGTTVLFEASDSNGFMENIQRIDLATGKTEVIYTPPEPTGQEVVSKDGLIKHVGWVDNTVALFQVQSCRQCDGPNLPQLVSIDTTTGQQQAFYTHDGDGIISGSFRFSPDGTRLFMIGGKAHLLGYDPGADYGAYVYEIDLASKTANLLGSAGGIQKVAVFAGMESNGDVLFFNQSVYNSSDQISSRELVRFNAINGTTSVVPIEVDNFDVNSSYQNVIADASKILFTVLDYSSDSGQTELSAYMLPLGGEENVIEFLGKEAVNGTHGFDRIFYAEQ